MLRNESGRSLVEILPVARGGCRGRAVHDVEMQVPVRGVGRDVVQAAPGVVLLLDLLLDLDAPVPVHPVHRGAVGGGRGDLHPRVGLRLEAGQLVGPVEHDLARHQLGGGVAQVVLGELQVGEPPLHLLQDPLLGQVGDLPVVVGVAAGHDGLVDREQGVPGEPALRGDDREHEVAGEDDGPGQLVLREGGEMREDADPFRAGPVRIHEPQETRDDDAGIQAALLPGLFQRAGELFAGEGKARGERVHALAEQLPDLR